MKRLVIFLLAVAITTLAFLPASAMPVSKLSVMNDNIELVRHRRVCDQFGRCYRKDHSRRIVRRYVDPYYDGPSYYYGYPRGYGYRSGPSVGFGFGVGPRW